MAAPNQYDLARQRATGQSDAQKVQGQDAIQRRAARAGNLNAGVVAKQSQLNEQAAANTLQQAHEGINAQEMAEKERLAEAERGRTWQSGESALTRRHATTEREASQGWQTGEREGTQIFQAGQSQLDRDQDKSQFDQTLGFQKEQQATSETQWQTEFDANQAQNLTENEQNIKNNEITQLMNMMDAEGMTYEQLIEFSRTAGFQYVTPEMVRDMMAAKRGTPTSSDIAQAISVANSVSIPKPKKTPTLEFRGGVS
jgi:hypothetical protein